MTKGNKMKRFILCGDSFAWGYEVLPPERHSDESRYTETDIHFEPELTKYREEHRYGGIIARHYDAELIDLSQCGAANTTIVRKLINYLAKENYFSSDVDNSDTLVSIGWTSPSRIEAYSIENNGYMSCNNLYSAETNNSTLGKLFENYFRYSSHPIDYLNSWTQEVFKIYTLLKTYKIPFVMHQAFYQIDFLKNGKHIGVLESNGLKSMIASWRDKLFWENVEDNFTSESKALWDCIEEKNFIFKSEYKISTMNEYIIQNEPGVNKALGMTHPNQLGHRIWADYMISHLNKNFI